jgi:hypothetical protein
MFVRTGTIAGLDRTVMSTAAPEPVHAVYAIMKPLGVRERTILHASAAIGVGSVRVDG